MEMSKTPEEYIDKHPEWEKELNFLRQTVLKTEAQEAMKWGTPHYTIGGKNVVGIGAFKAYVGLWFHQGVFLRDDHQVLINAQEGTTKGLRQWRFQSVEEMDEGLILQYVAEAIQNQKEGKEIKPEPKKFPMPDELAAAMKDNTNLRLAFEALKPGKQKEYLEHIGTAKQEKTRLSRLEKCIPMILRGEGLNDRYK